MSAGGPLWRCAGRRTYLRCWPIRTTLKGLRERWPLAWWRRLALQVWYERSNQLQAVTRIHFDIDLQCRRDRRIYGGEREACKAAARRHNAYLARRQRRWSVECGAQMQPVEGEEAPG